AYVAAVPIPSPIFQIAIVDVDTGLVVATATSSPADLPFVVEGAGILDCVFEPLLLHRRQFALRLTITDRHQLVSYDVITAGPRFAITSGSDGRSVESGEEDGIVTLPHRFEHHVRVLS